MLHMIAVLSKAYSSLAIAIFFFAINAYSVSAI